MASAQLKDIWKIKGIVYEDDLINEHSNVELSDEELESTKQILSSYGNNNGKEDDDSDDSCESDNSEVCGNIANNKFSVLEVSD